jgi:hypothetical protein
MERKKLRTLFVTFVGTSHSSSSVGCWLTLAVKQGLRLILDVVWGMQIKVGCLIHAELRLHNYDKMDEKTED